ncbi:MnmC family methyltransferase [Methanococcus maripaludis]|uniref:tRNA U34 5-methylaminomethyl-2-thiouridine-forming methyltransferase MnmC n=1 Tax=Methanococcus maripaludis TaxID=39152 RepID=A0A7J9PBH6_METMI|nr:MnmC family methyltransferase [Methanococcus maripaludis]MBA2860575.1 tRNA U34 5-methylaminomethyl-2-thiouridine-forming methyltransferase MnmC [Methanococcus maripaludis]
MLPNKKALDLIKIYMKKDFTSENLKELTEKLIKLDLLIKTEDGTFTVRSDDPEELMHSRVGALKEGIEKFAVPSKVKDIKNPKILDLCSGMGYNAVSALHYNIDSKIDMVEYSKEMLFLSLALDIPMNEHLIVKNAISEFFKVNRNQKIRIFNEDARITLLRKDLKKYDCVFHDAFSPLNDPVLYTVEFLKLIYENMADSGVLISYSSSIPFRSALVECGFIISEGPAVGRKRGATLAYKNPNELQKKEIKRIPESDERLIALSGVGIPFYDKNLNLNSSEIIKNRELDRENLKNLLENKYYSTTKIKSGKIDEKLLNIQKENLNSSEIIKKMKKIYLQN